MTILFLQKSSPLISMPVQVAGHYAKDGTYIKPHMRMQKVSMQPHQAESHAHEQKNAAPSRLDSFIEKHGGAARLRDELADMKPEQRAKLIDAMAHIDGIEPHAIMQRLGMHDEAKPEAAKGRPDIVEHVTGKGKTLRGIVLHGVTKEQAEERDPYTFKKNGGWFVREKHLTDEERGEPEVAATPASTPAPAQAPAPAPGPEPKVEPVKSDDANTRDAFTVKRVDDDGEMQALKFERGEKVKIAGAYPMHEGIIEGISQADGKVKVGNVWHDFGYVYKQDYDEFKQPRSEVDAGIKNLSDRLDAGNSIEAELMLRDLRSKAGTYSLSGYGAEFDRLHSKIIDVEADNRKKYEESRAAEAARAAEKQRQESEAQATKPRQVIRMTMDEWKKVHRDFRMGSGTDRATMYGGKTYSVEIVKDPAQSSDGKPVDADAKPEPQAEEGPKDGDTKEGADGTLIFRDGRWHKQDEPEPVADQAAHAIAERDEVPDVEAEPEDAAEAEPHEENIQKLRDKIEQMGGVEKVAAILQQSRKTDKARSDALIDNLAESMGVSREEVLGELGLKEVAKKRELGRKKVDPASLDIDDPDNPNSKNYRYADTGHVSGSRKEMASARAVIDLAKKEGARVYTTAINWEQIEQNPREAKNLITKSNLFGTVDWVKLKDGGMEPGAGFIIDRIYASIGTEPSTDSAQARQDYTNGLQSLRDRLEACKTQADVDGVLDDMRAEYDGTMMTAQESEQYKELRQEDFSLANEHREISNSHDPLYQLMQSTQSTVYSLEHDIRKRKSRGWKTDEQEAKLLEAQAAKKEAGDAWSEKLTSTQPRRDEIRSRREAIQKQIRAIQLAALTRNQEENPMHRAWKTMGDRFVGVIKYRSSKGSDAFANHMASVKAGKVKDWSWSEKESASAPRVTKEGERFQLLVADTYERKGGRDVVPDSTLALKDAFGLRDVQSGNWVLRDPVSAKFHTEQSAAAFADLADLLGADDNSIALNGRLALAFGARGTGGKGAARAHYEPVQRVINLTKMGGGGALGHEWFHALDNMIVEAETGKPAGTEVFASKNPDLLPAGDLRDAFQTFHDAMWSGTHRASDTHAYTASDYANAKRIMARPTISRSGPSDIIKNAGDVHSAFQQLDRYFKTEGGKKSGASKRMLRISGEWKALAAAHFGGNADGGEIVVESGKQMSSFAKESMRMDMGGQHYWASTEEMAARAFQGWIEDRLADKGQRNDYLSNSANNKMYQNSMQKWKPFPEGEERTRINAAIDKIVAAMQKQKTLLKACVMLDQ